MMTAPRALTILLFGLSFYGVTAQGQTQPTAYIADKPMTADVAQTSANGAVNSGQQDQGEVVEALISPNDTDTSVNEKEQDSDDELILITRGIYQCRDGKNNIFADEENRHKYHDCVQIRAPQYERAAPEVDLEQQPSCSGAIVYAGSTYIFSDKEPCPIPEEVFKARNPIEANPEYYTQPKP